MAGEDSLAVWGRMTFQERMYVLGQNYPDGIPQDVIDRLIEDEIKRQYGYLAPYLSNPEIGPILKQAATEGWTQERLQAELYKTNYWKTTSQATREWDLLSQSDPAEAHRRQVAMAQHIRAMAEQAGLGQYKGYEDIHYMFMAGLALRAGQSDEEILQGLFAQQQYQGGAVGGTMGASMTEIKGRADDYGLPMSEQAAFDWSKQIAAGLGTNEGVEAYLREQAKQRYSWLAADLDRGATVKQLFDPILQEASRLLEISPADISLNDPRFQAIIDHTDEQGVRRSMTGAEAANYIRSTEDWQKTTNARRDAAGLGEQILQAFGKVAS